MNKLLTLAVLGAMATSPAWAAGGSQQRSDMGGQQQSQMGSGSQQQALDQDMVRQIQTELKNQGQNVQVDGIMGPNTQQALRQFQEQQGISPSGQVDSQTLAALGVSEGGTQQAQTPQDQEQEQDRSPQPQRQSDEPQSQGGMSR